MGHAAQAGIGGMEPAIQTIIMEWSFAAVTKSCYETIKQVK
jgi:hypothetical protein